MLNRLDEAILCYVVYFEALKYPTLRSTLFSQSVGTCSVTQLMIFSQYSLELCVCQRGVAAFLGFKAL